jgi:hypothetical protein
MSMSDYSILVGKTYRTADGELRQVKAFADGEVVYRAVGATPGPGMLTRSESQRLSLVRFAADAESEVSESA